MVASRAGIAGRRLPASHRRHRDGPVRPEPAAGLQARSGLRRDHREDFRRRRRVTMRLASHEIWIARPPAEVFDYFVDFSKAARWRQYVRTMDRLDTGPLRAGSRLRVIMD